MRAIVTHESQHIDLLASTAGQFNALAYWLPTIWHAGSQRKASFVTVIQIVLARLNHLDLEFCQLSFVLQIYFGPVCCLISNNTAVGL